MTQADRRAWMSIPLVVLLGATVAAAGSQGGATVAGAPVFALAVSAAFVIQWVVFLPSFAARTERFFDLTGSMTYVSITLLAVVLTGGVDARGLLLAGMVLAWALPLGTFLFRRVSRAGKDDRFDALKESFAQFLLVWTLQGLWVTLTAAAAWVAITSERQVPLGWLAIVGGALWAGGFGLEVVADRQKSRFNADPATRGRFIATGLWAWSRHPNYLGEILLWSGVALVAAPSFQGWQWVAVVSPLFVTALLTRVSGVPLLERKSDARWGGQAEYEAYKRNTPLLIPRLRRAR